MKEKSQDKSQDKSQERVPGKSPGEVQGKSPGEVQAESHAKAEEGISSESTADDRGSGMKRRNFVRLVGGGVAVLGAGIFIYFRPWRALGLSKGARQAGRSLTKDYNAFLHIQQDGMISCYTGKIEMGQGIITSLPMMMADELNVPTDKIRIVMGDTELCPYDAGTWGSLTTQQFGPAMRAALAEARAVLVEMASEQLNVPADRLEVRDGVVTDTANPETGISYAELAKGKKLEKYLDVKPPVEDHTEFSYVGKAVMRTDSYEKVTGKAIYTADLRLPGMVFARILRPPSHGASLKSVDVSAAEEMQGVEVVRDGDFIAVLSENRDTVDEAIVKIDAEYTFDELDVNDRTLFDWLQNPDSAVNVLRSTGNIDQGSRASDFIFESEFHDGYCAHASIETHTALAMLEGDKLTVWAATQTPFGLQDALVREFDMPHEKVRVIVPFVGGGFGGKIAFQEGIEVARLAKLSGKPVMLEWTREEEFFYDNFHPASVIRIKSGIDKDGLIKMWDYHLYYGGTRGADAIYDVPHVRITNYSQSKKTGPVHPVLTGSWRAPNNNTNTFARESQIDMMASKAGIDPLEFRLKNLKDENMIDCLKAAADKFGYTPAKAPSGRGIGIACGFDAGTWVAVIAQVIVDRPSGRIKVERVVAAQDMGLCVNPQGAVLQMEGCVNMGLGYALREEVFFEGGKVFTNGFDNYEIPKFSWIPEIECVILDRRDKPPKGGGEPVIIAIGAIIANAVYDATGARLYRMPMSPERVLEALEKV
ncbi:MAG: molybdopterin-dependent oxidoreductase [Bacteroidales bacterium]|jgi:isoquinoline 1-oxidoreductase|nr:molybdopterin-dependent oxidoreductase [Bacteroidales bacterium]